MIKELHAWPNFLTELEDIKTLQRCFQASKVSYIPLGQNSILDSLIRTAKKFQSELCFISCFIPDLVFKPLTEKLFNIKRTQIYYILYTFREWNKITNSYLWSDY